MIDFSKRLGKMKKRRHGVDNISDLDLEFYEDIDVSDSLRYLVGAMAEVKEEYTQISLEEGERVFLTLKSLLESENINIDMEYQGSVPLNIHITGTSDVDVLVILKGIITVEEPHRAHKKYRPTQDRRDMIDILKELRLKSEEKLDKRYHVAEVDIPGKKAISISGGSLKRTIDIVPACWHDTHFYQDSNNSIDRGILIYDKNSHELILNTPFLHMSLINQLDEMYKGNLKKVIRLMKNVIADMPEAKNKEVSVLSSYDLASLAYSMKDKLEDDSEYNIELLKKLVDYLDELINGKQLKELYTPDRSRKIIDSIEKINAFEILIKELDDLYKTI